MNPGVLPIPILLQDFVDEYSFVRKVRRILVRFIVPPLMAIHVFIFFQFSSLWPCVVFTHWHFSWKSRTLFIEWRCRIWWWCVCSCHLASCSRPTTEDLRTDHGLEARRNPTNFLKQSKGMKPNLIYRFFFIFTYTDSNVSTPSSWFLMIGISLRSVTAGWILRLLRFVNFATLSFSACLAHRQALVVYLCCDWNIYIYIAMNSVQDMLLAAFSTICL